jgi:hypothetical protein
MSNDSNINATKIVVSKKETKRVIRYEPQGELD